MSSSVDGSPDPQSRGRFANKRLRRASFISPLTGERSKRVFTLREASHRQNDDSNAPAGERTPLLGQPDEGAVDDPEHPRWSALIGSARQQSKTAYGFATSKTGLGILKCSLAYLLGSLATLVPAISGLIGHRQDSKHMVATVIVWFHPARSIGSMHEVSLSVYKTINSTTHLLARQGHY